MDGPYVYAAIQVLSNAEQVWTDQTQNYAKNFRWEEYPLTP